MVLIKAGMILVATPIPATAACSEFHPNLSFAWLHQEPDGPCEGASPQADTESGFAFDLPSKVDLEGAPPMPPSAK